MPLLIPGPTAYTRGARIALVLFVLVVIAAAVASRAGGEHRAAAATAAGAPVQIRHDAYGRAHPRAHGHDLRAPAPTSSLAGTAGP